MACLLSVPPEGLADSCGLLREASGSSSPEMRLYGVNEPPPVAVGVPLSSGGEKESWPGLGLDPGKQNG